MKGSVAPQVVQRIAQSVYAAGHTSQQAIQCIAVDLAVMPELEAKIGMFTMLGLIIPISCLVPSQSSCVVLLMVFSESKVRVAGE